MPLFGVAETGWYYCGVRGKVGGNPYHIRCVLKHVEPKKGIQKSFKGVWTSEGV